jgi:hypothetical protein
VATIAVCRKCKQAGCVVELLDRRTDAAVDLVRCQKICHGPVVGVLVEGRMEWFERVRGVKPLAALLRVAKKRHPSKVAKPLRKLRVPKRSGRRPR